MGSRNSKVSPSTAVEQNNDELLLVWLNPTITSLKYDHECQLLRGIVDRLEVFDNTDRCVDYITHPRRDKLILIISSPLAEFLIGIIHDFRSITTIYIYSNEQLTVDTQCFYPKLKGTFNDIVALMNNLKGRVRMFRWFRPIEFTSATAEPSTKDDDLSESDTDLSFLFGSLIQDIFLEAPVYKNERDEFIEHCSTRFAGDKAKLKDVKKFKRDYRSDQAVLWYTKATFIFAILNQALREQDFNLLFMMRFFIRDLAQQLDKIKKNDANGGTNSTVTLYRGQGMSKTDFDRRIKQKVGGFLSIHEFLSTSLDPMVADMFLAYQPNVESIIFEITWQETNEKNFANIATDSMNPDEEECLFRMGCVFRIEKVERIENPIPNGGGFWKVFLTPSSVLQSTSDDWRSFYNNIKFEIDQEPTILHRLAKMMFILGEYAKAKEMYMTLLSTTDVRDRLEMAYLHFKLGRINDDDGLPEKAYEHFCQAQSYLPLNSAEGPRQEVYIHLHLGHTLQQMGRLAEARNHVQEALAGLEKGETEHFIGMNYFDVNERYYSILAAIFHDEGNFQEAFENRTKCLRSRLFFYRHIQKWKVGESYNDIAAYYLAMKNYIRAHEYYLKALTIQRKSLVPNHPARAATHANLALVLELLGKLDEATHHIRLAVKIFEHTHRTVEHPRLRAYQLTYSDLFQKLLTERLNALKHD